MAERQIDLTLSVQEQHFHRLLAILEDDEYTSASLVVRYDEGRAVSIPISDIEGFQA